MKKISRVLIANRGEIAVRIIRACREIGIETILAVSQADKESLPAKMADRSICIGPPAPAQSYLKVDTIIAAALGTGSDAIHPGYGFLAEQPKFPRACAEHGLIFIGPHAENIRQMGDKLLARQVARSVGIPMIPGSELVTDHEEALKTADTIGYPVLLKASAGGGGKGMKIVQKPQELKTAFAEASAEARSAFGDDRMYMEKLIANARHIEIQIMGDSHGNFVHLFERDCSLQRRYQKLVEESPSTAVNPELREKICRAALDIARNIKNENAGTVEFILDQDQNQFYFLEMNTRIQVEHPVTEIVTGTDLVQEQFHIAVGEPLSFKQEDIKLKGHAVECRINAESPDKGFMPNPGLLTQWQPREGANIRIDTHCFPGYFVPPYYDSLLAKVITIGPDRSQAIGRMKGVLDGFTYGGLDTNIPFHRMLMDKKDYLQGNINTRWVENILAEEKK